MVDDEISWSPGDSVRKEQIATWDDYLDIDREPALRRTP